MLDQGTDLEPGSESTPPLKEESSNRTFIIAAGALAGVVLLSIIGMAAYALLVLPKQKAASLAQAATIQAQNMLVAGAMTQTADAALWTPTALPTAIPTATATSTATLKPTPVEAFTTSLPTASVPIASATLSSAALSGLSTTQTTIANQTATAKAFATSTALAKTGFADEFGLPGLFIMAFVLVAVILLSRRLRTKPAS
jgi:hypothetical protein